MHAIGENGLGRRLGHGIVVGHPSPAHVTVESPWGTKHVAPISHVSSDHSAQDNQPNTPDRTPSPQPVEAATKWAQICDRLDPRITADPHWPTLAAQLDRAAAGGTDVESLLHQVTRNTALPPDHPARSLGYCVAAAAPDTPGALIQRHPGAAHQSPAACSTSTSPAVATPWDGYRPSPRR